MDAIKAPPQKRKSPAQGRGHSRDLDRAKILAAARELAREGGAAAVTMRGIARALAVDPAALYWHFEDKATLLDALARDAADERALDVPGSGPWQARARALCSELARRLAGDPALKLTGRGDASLGPFYAHATGAAARVLADAGLTGEELVFAAHTLVHTVTAVLQAQASLAGSEVDAIRDYMRGVSSELPADEADRWVAIARRDATHTFDAYLDRAVDIVIAGIETRLEAQRAR